MAQKVERFIMVMLFIFMIYCFLEGLDIINFDPLSIKSHSAATQFQGEQPAETDTGSQSSCDNDEMPNDEIHRPR